MIYDKIFNYSNNDTVFVFTPIFAPTDLEKSVKHGWKWYDQETGTWNTTNIVDYQVIGGRKGGYREFIFKENIWPGPWRIDVKTADGMVLDKNRISDNPRQHIH